MSEIKAKTIVTKSKLPEVDYCFNPYVGCTHGCTYCYARFMGRFTGHADEKWGTYLDWKINAPELLKKEILKIKKQGGTVIIGSVTDCYQPIEEKINLTRQCLEIFLEHQIPISILTKNVLVKKDFDLLRQFKHCELGVSISILDEQHQRILEPGTSNPRERITVLEEAHALGIETYAFLGPIHPFLTNIEDIFKEVSPFVKFIMAEVPNLRCGNWKDFSEALIKLDIDPSEYKRIAESDSFYKKIKGLIERLCEEKKIELRGIFRH
ncbi:radical SAM protein [bacterium]|nr:radical SAM protein [bacterium]